MNRHSIRVYTDTSVFGGVFDLEFAEVSQAFFNQIQSKRFCLIVSAIVSREIEPSPPQVKDFYNQMLDIAEIVKVTEDSLWLQRAYLNAGIVSAKSSLDALHVAIATVSQASLIVSWNFKHIVHFEKIPLYNAINKVNGYPEIAIHTPQEVIGYEG